MTAQPADLSLPGERLRRALPILLVLVCVLLVSVHFGLWKSGMFIDEIYSYGLSNSHYMPFIGNGSHDRIEEQIITRGDFEDYLMVTDSEPRFDAGSVYYNQEQDVHPPLFYWILNFFSSLTPGVFSKWTGLVPNIALHLLTVYLVYALMLELFAGGRAGGAHADEGERLIAAATAMLYGLSHMGLSTCMMIRMYALMAMFTVLLALLAAKELRAPSLRLELGIAAVLFGGMMTQYYFVFYAFFLCAAVLLTLLIRRAWKPALRFALLAFAGVGLMLLCYPAALMQITAGRLGPQSDALENLRNLSAWAGRLRYYFGQLRVGLPVAVAVGVLGLVLCAVCAAARKELRLQRDDFRFLILLLPVVPTVFIPALISPVTEGRYISNIMPICVLAPGFMMLLLRRYLDRVPQVYGRVFCALVAAAALVVSMRDVPDYIYDEHRAFQALSDSHADDPCVYLTGYFSGITQDMLQLMSFDEVYVTEDPASPGLQAYLAEKASPECVVYVDVSSFWGSGLDPDAVLPVLLQEADYESFEAMYGFGLSEAFLLKNQSSGQG